jgi:hypothetical protein
MIPFLLDNIEQNFHEFFPGMETPDELLAIKVPGKAGAQSKVNVLVYGNQEDQLLAACMFPRSPDADFHVAREADNLRRFHEAMQGGPAMQMLPRVLFDGPIEGVRVLMEEGIPGVSLQEVLASGKEVRDALMTCAFGLAEMHKATTTKRITVDEACLKEWLFDPWDELLHRFPDYARQQGEAVTAWLREAAEAVTGMEIPLTGQHGDFSSFNIRIDGERIAVIDWEDARFDFPPFLDMNNFIISNAHQLQKGFTPMESMDRFALSSGTYRNLVNEMTGLYCQALDIAPSFLMMMAPACMMHMARMYMEPHRGQEHAVQHWLDRIAAFTEKVSVGECW